VVEGASFVIEFVWAPHIVTGAEKLLQVQRQSGSSLKSVLVAGLNFWEGEKNFDNYRLAGKSDEAYWGAVASALDPVVQRASNFVWLTARELNELWGKNGRCFGADRAQEGKNAYFRSWVAQKGGQIIPADRIESAHAFFLNQIDRLHTQCSFLKRFPLQVGHDIKTPFTGDCRDLFSLNCVQILLRMLV
jgi:hypothetical protein